MALRYAVAENWAAHAANLWSLYRTTGFRERLLELHELVLFFCVNALAVRKKTNCGERKAGASTGSQPLCGVLWGEGTEPFLVGQYRTWENVRRATLCFALFHLVFLTAMGFEFGALRGLNKQCAAEQSPLSKHRECWIQSIAAVGLSGWLPTAGEASGAFPWLPQRPTC